MVAILLDEEVFVDLIYIVQTRSHDR
jgi:hypothetical protein